MLASGQLERVLRYLLDEGVVEGRKDASNCVGQFSFGIVADSESHTAKDELALTDPGKR